MAKVVISAPPKRPEVEFYFDSSSLTRYKVPSQYAASNILLNRENDPPISVLIELMQECWQERKVFGRFFESF